MAFFFGKYAAGVVPGSTAPANRASFLSRKDLFR
jgi:hypothetical protein